MIINNQCTMPKRSVDTVSIGIGGIDNCGIVSLQPHLKSGRGSGVLSDISCHVGRGHTS